MIGGNTTIGKPRGLCVLLFLGAAYSLGIIFHSLGIDSSLTNDSTTTNKDDSVFFAPLLLATTVFPRYSSTASSKPHHPSQLRSRSRENERLSDSNDNTTKHQQSMGEQKMSYLNATSLLQSGHFDRVARSILVALADGNDTTTITLLDKSSGEVCSLKFPVRFSKHNNQVPQIYKDPIEGLYYNKVPKTASSTLASINQRIAFRWGHRLHAASIEDDETSNAEITSFTKRNTSCSHKQAHILGAGKYYGNRVPSKSFLWGSVRDPASRALSRIFFDAISQQGRPSRDGTILRYLKQDYNPQSGTTSKGKGGFQLQYLSLESSTSMPNWYAWDKESPTLVKRPDVIKDRVHNVIRDYDLIVLTERLDESIVALQLLLGLPVGDVLSMSAKMGGGYFYEKETRACIPIQKTRRSLAVQVYLDSDEWQAVNYGDYLLYAAANQSLDWTIDERLGRDRFDEALRLYRQVQQIVDQECSSETYFPCSVNGTVQLKLSASNCYTTDEGCGYACIDRVVRERGW
jgi:hypothetical protein